MGLDDVCTEQLAVLTERKLMNLRKLKDKFRQLEQYPGSRKYDCDDREQSISRLQRHLNKLEPLLSDVSYYVTELKRHLKSLHNAEVVRDYDMVAIAARHTVSFSVRLLQHLYQNHYPPTVGMYSITELTTNVLSTLSSRDDCHCALRESGGIKVLVNMLDPCIDSKVLEDVATAIGNVACDSQCRWNVSKEGGVSALVQLIKPSRPKRVRVACTIALALLSVKDSYIQDCLRHQGALDDLVSMLSSNDDTVADVAKLALQSARHHNLQNRLHVSRAVRCDYDLCRDPCKMALASELTRASTSPAPTGCCTQSKLSKPKNLNLDICRPTSKPLSLYTVPEVCDFLKELGFCSWDMTLIKNNRVTGSDLICITENEMKYDLCLPRMKVKKLKNVQEAHCVFEKIAKQPCRGRITELELRVWLAAKGVHTCDINFMINHFRKLSSSCDSAVSFWDFALGYEWFACQLQKCCSCCAACLLHDPCCCC